MAGLSDMGIDLLGIGKALLNKNLAVPVYQRSYAWEAKHVRDLFDDLETAIANRQAEYFLGSIVTTRTGPSSREVVDGQQRLATTAILLAAIRDYFHWKGDFPRSTKIQSDYLLNTDLETMDRVPRLKLNDDDNDFFSKRILAPPDSPERSIRDSKDSHRKILRAAEARTCALLRKGFSGSFAARPCPAHAQPGPDSSLWS